MKNRKQKIIDIEKGFTLIELLLVIAIVTLLSSAFFYSSTQARNKAEDAHMKMEAKQVETAISMYKEDNNGQVPHYDSLESGKLYREGDNNDAYENNMNLLVKDGYLSEIPTSPDGNSYAYGFTTDFLDSLFIVDLNTEETDLIVGDKDAIISFSNQPPTIITQHQEVTGEEHGTVTFSVVASGTEPLTYQWQKNNGYSTLYDGIIDTGATVSGVNSATLTISNITLNDQASYRVIISNVYGSVTSNSIGLSIAPSEFTIDVIVIGEGSVEGGQSSYPIGTTASLGAITTPTSGWKFQSWSGCDETSDITCYLLMNSDKTVTVTFVPSNDTQIPIITTFEIPESTLTDSEDLWGPSKPKTITISNFSGTDNVGITGYLITENPTEPSKNDPNWSSTKPTSYTIENPEIENGTTINLYAWLKDEAGNISLSQNDSTIIYFLVLSPP